MDREDGRNDKRMTYKIMIVEDDATITQVLTRQLQNWGYQVHAVTDFTTVLEQFNQFAPHLVLLDISLPFWGGYHWCQQIRRVSQAPIIFISSAGDHMNQVMALNMGADDFIPKPFEINIVMAKIHALLRRAYSFGADLNVLEYGGAVLNLGEASLSCGEETLELTKNEFKMLQVLFEYRGNAVSRDTMMQRLWETDSFVDDNTLTVNMTRLRKKLEGIGLEGFILTKKGMGYRLRSEE